MRKIRTIRKITINGKTEYRQFVGEALNEGQAIDRLNTNIEICYDVLSRKHGASNIKFASVALRDIPKDVVEVLKAEAKQ